MRHDFIDRFSRIESPIHRLGVGIKFISLLLIIITIVTVPGNLYFLFLTILILLLLIVKISKIPFGFIFKRLLLMEPFVIGIAILSIFQPDGLSIFFRILVKSTLCLLTIIVFSNLTRFNDLINFLKKIRMPSVFLNVIALMYRYIFILIDEAERMQRARKSRTFTENKRTYWLTQSSLIGQLFIRSYERGERIYRAMRARGFS